MKWRARIRFWSRYKFGGAVVPWWGLVPLHKRVTDWMRVNGERSVGVPEDVDYL